jgi:hypothetical protein
MLKICWNCHLRRDRRSISQSLQAQCEVMTRFCEPRQWRRSFGRHAEAPGQPDCTYCTATMTGPVGSESFPALDHLSRYSKWSIACKEHCLVVMAERLANQVGRTAYQPVFCRLATPIHPLTHSIAAELIRWQATRVQKRTRKPYRLGRVSQCRVL